MSTPFLNFFLLNYDRGALGVFAGFNPDDSFLRVTLADGVEGHGGVLVFDLLKQGDQFGNGHGVLHSGYFLSLGGFPS